MTHVYTVRVGSYPPAPIRADGPREAAGLAATGFWEEHEPRGPESCIVFVDGPGCEMTYEARTVWDDYDGEEDGDWQVLLRPISRHAGRRISP